MHRLLFAVTIATSVGLIACACVSPSDIVDVAADINTAGNTTTLLHESPPGFYLNGEFVSIGPFDPTDTTLEPIRACEEIPADILEAAGMRMSGFSPGTTLPYNGPSALNIGDIYGCTGAVDDPNRELMDLNFTTGPRLVDDVVQQDILIDDAPNSVVPSLVIHQMANESEQSCSVSIDTSRGFFSITAIDYIYNTDHLMLCAIAQDSMETIYTQLRGEHHD